MAGSAGQAELTLVSRDDCELCEHMQSELAELAQRYRLPPLRMLDVDSDPQLQRRFGLKIPVLLWGETLVCHGRLDRAELLRLLRL